MKCSCRRCGTNTSVFWTPITIGTKEDVGDEHSTFYLCDSCQYDLSRFLMGYVVHDMVQLSRRKEE